MTANEQQSLVERDPAFDHDRLRAHEADFTPCAVVEQGLTWLRDKCDLTPRSMLDPCAGAGVFCKAARAVWPDIWIAAIDLREEERPHLERWADQVWIGSFQDCAWPAHDAMSFDLEQQGFDLVATNPPFSLAADCAATGLELAEKVLLLCTDDWFQRGEDRLNDALDRKLIARLWWQLLIPGAIDFRGGAINPKSGKPFGTDAKSYSWWLWEPEPIKQDEGFWNAEVLLPRLSGEQRRWRVRPGTEDAT